MSSGIWLIAVTGFLYLGGIFGLITLARWRRQTRWPFKEEDRLLRGPGETLRQRIAGFDEQFVFELVGGLMLIFLALGLVAEAVYKLLGWTAKSAGILAVLAGLVVMSVSIFRLV